MDGDTIGLAATDDVNGSNTYTIEASTLDTLVSARNVIQNASGAWKSTVFDIGYFNRDQIIYPIIQLECPTCAPTNVKGISNNDLTFFGSYPNPATNNINIRFAVKKSTNVTVELYDVTGKMLNKIVKNNVSAGEQIISFETAALANGNYIYTITTREGGAFASQFTIAK